MKKKITSTNKSAFFKLLNRAARPQSQSGGKTSAHQNAGGYGGNLCATGSTHPAFGLSSRLAFCGIYLIDLVADRAEFGQ